MRAPRRIRRLIYWLCLAALPACSDDAPAGSASDATIDPERSDQRDAAASDAGDAGDVLIPTRPDELGPFAVGHTSFTAEDPARADRELLIDAWYPVDPADAAGAEGTAYPLAPLIDLESEVAVEGAPVSPGRWTLVVFSPGYRGIHTQSIELMEALASHGFVVASPEHAGNAQASPDDTFDVAAANRVPDVSFVIDTIFGRATDPPDLFFEHISHGDVGVVGHSFGGMTAIGMAAGWAGADPDPRVAAIAPISAVIDGELQEDDRPSNNAGFSEEQLGSVAVPVILIGGTEDVNVPIENNDLAFEQMTDAPVVYQVDIEGANHTHFANVCAFGDLLIEIGIPQESWPALGAEALLEPYEATCGEDAFPIDEAIRLLNLYVVAFFRHHLSDDATYGEYLTEASAADEPAVSFSTRVR